MQKTDTDIKTIQGQKLGREKYYYKYVFKKTEKIICAVFYIFHNKEKDTERNTTVKDTLDSARDLHDQVLMSLRANTQETATIAERLEYSLLELESKLRVSAVSTDIAPEQLHVFVSEIDSVIRTLVQLSSQSGQASDLLSISADPVPTKQSSARSSAPAARSVSTPQSAPATQQLSRRERIVQVLTARGQASIKDVSDVVKDCSEKTIQRELNAMIKDNLVAREGERRWSTYSLI